MKHNIACCYLTHNHPMVMREVLSIVKDYYNCNGIDIYIYDSSTNRETEKIVTELVSNGASNIYYVNIDEKLGADGKIVEIFKGIGLKKKYEYIWANKDRSYVTEKTARAIQRECAKGYDCILNDCYIPIETERRTYKEIYRREEFFSEFGWLTTSWDTVLLSSRRILDKIDWKEYEEKYDIGINNNFNQVMILFAGLSDEARIKVIHGDEAGIFNSKQIQKPMGIPFETWGKNWPAAIRKLPKYYEPYMKKVIKDVGRRTWIFGSLDNLILLAQNNILTDEVWKDIKNDWTNLSDISVECVEAILNKKYEEAVWLSFERFNLALLNQKYDYAFEIINKNNIWAEILGLKIYWMLHGCFVIYLQEVREGKDPGIMQGVKSYKDILIKYQTLKFYVRRLEYGIDEQNEKEVIEFVKGNHISSIFLGYVIQHECIDVARVIEKWESLCLT